MLQNADALFASNVAAAGEGGNAGCSEPENSFKVWWKNELWQELFDSDRKVREQQFCYQHFAKTLLSNCIFATPFLWHEQDLFMASNKWIESFINCITDYQQGVMELLITLVFFYSLTVITLEG